MKFEASNVRGLSCTYSYSEARVREDNEEIRKTIKNLRKDLLLFQSLQGT